MSVPGGSGRSTARDQRNVPGERLDTAVEHGLPDESVVDLAVCSFILGLCILGWLACGLVMMRNELMLLTNLFEGALAPIVRDLSLFLHVELLLRAKDPKWPATISRIARSRIASIS